MENTSEKIKMLMRLKGVKGADVCRETGIPESTLSRNLNNKNSMKLGNYIKITDYLENLPNK